MGCSSASLLLPVGGVGDGWVEGETEDSGVVGHGGAAAEFLGVIV